MDWIRFWEYTSDDWSGLQFAVLLIAAVVAYFQVREARRLRLERSRPFVVVDVEVSSGIGEFKIRNIGTTLARDVRFSFEPRLLSTFDHRGGKPIAELSLWVNGIPSLPPGREITAIFDQMPARDKAGLPDDYEVSVSYRDPLGNKYEDEPMTVGVSHRRDMVHRVRNDIHDVHKQLRTLVDEAKKWTKLQP